MGAALFLHARRQARQLQVAATGATRTAGDGADALEHARCCRVNAAFRRTGGTHRPPVQVLVQQDLQSGGLQQLLPRSLELREALSRQRLDCGASAPLFPSPISQTLQADAGYSILHGCDLVLHGKTAHLRPGGAFCWGFPRSGGQNRLARRLRKEISSPSRWRRSNWN
jgi:hypothetical protein